jgi:preprotein translocase subunit SecD
MRAGAAGGADGNRGGAHWSDRRSARKNIDKGFKSVTTYGFIVLAIFMCAYYRLMGVISTIALSVNLLLLIALLSMLQDADAAGHRGHRTDARHGDRRQRAHQRAHP